MSVDIKTAAVEPIRQTFDHLKERLGDKQPNRYQEAVFDIQPKVNFHYRPTWDPEHELYDTRRTAVKMEDFDQLLDPRQYYYGTYTIQRAKQQDSQEANFSFVEKRDLFATIPQDWKDKLVKLVLPVRHIAWGANTNNSFIAAYGYGAPVTSAATFQMTDELGNAQYITRIGLILGHNETTQLTSAKDFWLNDPIWQPMRRLVEDSMVVKDWFELHLLQNFLIDGGVYSLVFDRLDREIEAHGGAAFSMLTEFTAAWFEEAKRWTDAVLKVAAQESSENKTTIDGWLAAWGPRVREALQPLAAEAFGDQAEAQLDGIFEELAARAKKAGLSL